VVFPRRLEKTVPPPAAAGDLDGAAPRGALSHPTLRADPEPLQRRGMIGNGGDRFL
jgi:hypothetical protein